MPKGTDPWLEMFGNGVCYFLEQLLNSNETFDVLCFCSPLNTQFQCSLLAIYG